MQYSKIKEKLLSIFEDFVKGSEAKQTMRASLIVSFFKEKMLTLDGFDNVDISEVGFSSFVDYVKEILNKALFNEGLSKYAPEIKKIFQVDEWNTSVYSGLLSSLNAYETECLRISTSLGTRKTGAAEKKEHVLLFADLGANYGYQKCQLSTMFELLESNYTV